MYSLNLVTGKDRLIYYSYVCVWFRKHKYNINSATDLVVDIIMPMQVN